MFPKRRPLELVTVSEEVMKSDPGANIKQTTARCKMAARRKQ